MLLSKNLTVICWGTRALRATRVGRRQPEGREPQRPSATCFAEFARSEVVMRRHGMRCPDCGLVLSPDEVAAALANPDYLAIEEDHVAIKVAAGSTHGGEFVVLNFERFDTRLRAQVLGTAA